MQNHTDAKHADGLRIVGAVADLFMWAGMDRAADALYAHIEEVKKAPAATGEWEEALKAD